MRGDKNVFDDKLFGETILVTLGSLRADTSGTVETGTEVFEGTKALLLNYFYRLRILTLISDTKFAMV